MYISSDSYSLCGKKASTVHAVCAALVPLMRKLHDEFHFDGIVVRGTSGTSVGFALHFGKYDVPTPIIIARKEGESSHAGMFTKLANDKFNTTNFKRLLFLDDFVSTGSTVRTLHNDLRVSQIYCADDTGLVAVLCYRSIVYSPHGPHFMREQEMVCGIPVFEPC